MQSYLSFETSAKRYAASKPALGTHGRVSRVREYRLRVERRDVCVSVAVPVCTLSVCVPMCLPTPLSVHRCHAPRELREEASIVVNVGFA